MCDLFVLSRANIFEEYPRLLAEIISANKINLNDTNFLLPSDAEYLDCIYYKMLSAQRNVNRKVVKKKSEYDTENIDWEPLENNQNKSMTGSAINMNVTARTSTDDEAFSSDFQWNLEDLSKAIKLLRQVPVDQIFSNEFDMRRIFAMVYDVYRHKQILCQALLDNGWTNDQHSGKVDVNFKLVWLTLYDMYLRKFQKRGTNEYISQTELWKHMDLTDIHDRTWKSRAFLAATIARMRIGNNALNLTNLLPAHLENAKVFISTESLIVTGWFNPFKIRSKSTADNLLSDFGFKMLPEADERYPMLQDGEYLWENTICRLYLACRPTVMNNFANSTLITDNFIVLQDQSFSIGSAIFIYLIEQFNLEGDILQTHLLSPRSSGYICALLATSNKKHRYHVFGAGSKLREYLDYMKSLNIKNIHIHAENYRHVPPGSLENVSCIFLTPPNSYSAVKDPIDLICCRGGDLSILEMLTETEMNDSSKQRVIQILKEQRDCLRLSMAKPHIQFLLYETYSIINAENLEMVEQAVREYNHAVQVKHLHVATIKENMANLDDLIADRKHKLQRTLSKGSMVATSEYTSSNESSGSNTDSDVSIDSTTKIKIPKTDLFEIVSLPGAISKKYINTACSLTFIKRKTVTRWDDKTLISMAEKRGLFGGKKINTKQI